MSSDASPDEINMTHAAWYQSTTAYVRPSLGKSLWQVVNTFVPYFLLLALMVITVRRDYPYWTTLMLAIAAGGMLIRVFILFHDCCHGSFFASHRAPNGNSQRLGNDRGR